MERKAQTLFAVFFALVIGFVPVAQAVYELKKIKRIQAFDLIEDATTVPYQRAKAMAASAQKILAQIGILSTAVQQASADSVFDGSAFSNETDEIGFAIGELQKSAENINRYMKGKPDSPEMKTIAGLKSALDSLSGDISNASKAEDALGFIKTFDGKVTKVATKYPKPTKGSAIPLVIKNLPNMFWDAKYLRPYEKEMENTSIFAVAARPVMLFTRYLLFQDLGDKALLGQKNWFFYMPDVQFLSKPYILASRNYLPEHSNVADPNLLSVKEEPIKKIVLFRDELKKLGIELIVVVLPTKASIYPEMLNPKFSKENSGKFSHSLKSISELREQGVECVDLFTAFAAERQNDEIAGDSLYLSKDTHWRGRGVRCAAKVVADRIKQYSWYTPGTTNYEIDTLKVDRIGDIGNMTKITNVKFHDLLTVFPVEATKCYKVYKVDRDSAGNEISRSRYKDDYANSQVLLLGDSFSRIYQTDMPESAGWISHIAVELGQPIASIVSDGGASTLVRETLARKVNVLRNKKVVVWEFVERDFRYGAEGWKDIKLDMNQTASAE